MNGGGAAKGGPKLLFSIKVSTTPVGRVEQAYNKFVMSRLPEFKSVLMFKEPRKAPELGPWARYYPIYPLALLRLGATLQKCVPGHTTDTDPAEVSCWAVR